MRALLVAFGSYGDVHPFVGIGLEMMRRGHDVTVLVNEHFAPVVKRAGLGFLPLGPEKQYLDALEHPDMWHPSRGFGLLCELGVVPAMRPTYETIERMAAEGELCVVAHGLAIGARIAQERLGVRTVQLQLQPSLFRSEYETPAMPGAGSLGWMPRFLKRWLFAAADRFLIDPHLAGPVNSFRAELGLPPARRFFYDWWFSPDLVVGLFPEWFARPQPDWPRQIRLTGFPLFDERGMRPSPPELESFLAAGDPPIVFTPGSAMVQGRRFFEASAEACRRLGRRGLFLTPHRAQIPASLPPGVAHLEYAPFSDVLPRAAALVHHGGIGTLSQALAAGVPQLCKPMAYDQFDNAARVERLGCGLTLPERRYCARRAAAALGTLLSSDDVARACRETAARFQGRRPIDEACALIESFAPAPAVRR